MEKRVSRIESIDYLKALCAFFVILHHSISHISGEYGCQIPTWIKIITSPIYVHVPLFFVIGGGLCHPQPLKRYYSKKVKRVLIPFYFFTFLKLLYTNLVSDKFAHADTVLSQLYDGFILGRLYWFSYVVFIFYCIAPLMWKKKDGKPLICWVFFLSSLLISIADSFFGFLDKDIPFQLNSVVKYLPYFSLGILIQNYNGEIKKCATNLNKLVIIISCFVLYFALYFLSEKYYAFSNYFFVFLRLLTVMIFLYEIVDKLQENIVIRKIADYSYQLMLVDSFFRVIILLVINRLFTISFLWILPQTILSVIGGVVVCEIVYRTKLLRFLFGL